MDGDTDKQAVQERLLEVEGKLFSRVGWFPYEQGDGCYQPAHAPQRLLTGKAVGALIRQVTKVK